MYKKTLYLSMLAIVLLIVDLIGAAAEDNAPSITIEDQISLYGTVSVPTVVSEGPGWIVIHNVNEGVAPGAVIGTAPVHDGTNTNVSVPIDVSQATPDLRAMLHVDDNEMGVYEFGIVDGADAPVTIGENAVAVPFKLSAIAAFPQIVHDSFTAANIVTDAPGWLAVHQDVDGTPGPVIGVASLQAGNNEDVVVELDGEVTDTLFPMIHLDTGELGVFEFDSTDGVDGPMLVNGMVVVKEVSTTPAMAAYAQISIHAQNYAISNMAGTETGDMPTFTVASTLSDGRGWVVIHSDNDGTPGPVAGFAPVNDGLTTNIVVTLDPDLVTPVLWPMLHTDDGEVGVYEFGTVAGADAPVSVHDQILTFPVNVAPTVSAKPQPISQGGTIMIDSALIDADGWLAIHASVGGAPGPVVGVAPLKSGLNTNIVVHINLDGIDGASTDQVFPMLHYDTGEVGSFEFATVGGVDDYVMINDGPVGVSLTIQ